MLPTPIGATTRERKRQNRHGVGTDADRVSRRVLDPRRQRIVAGQDATRPMRSGCHPVAERPSARRFCVVLGSASPDPIIVHVVSQASRSWVDYLVAFGTLTAVLVAAWSAWNARAAAAATRDLVAVEKERDEDRRRDQVRRVSVTMALTPIDERVTFRVEVHNDSSGPVRNVRWRATLGNETWGPVLLAKVAAGERVTISGSTNSRESIDDAESTVRVIDMHDQPWIVTSHNKRQIDQIPLQRWIDDGAEFAGRNDEDRRIHIRREP